MIVIQIEYYDVYFKKNRIGYYGYDQKSGYPTIIENLVYGNVEKFDSVDDAVTLLEKEYIKPIINEYGSFVDMGEKIVNNPKVVNIELTSKVTELYEYK